MSLLTGHRNNVGLCGRLIKTTMPEMPAPLGVGQGVSVSGALSSRGRSNVGGSNGSATQEQRRVTAEKKSSCLAAPHTTKSRLKE